MWNQIYSTFWVKMKDCDQFWNFREFTYTPYVCGVFFTAAVGLNKTTNIIGTQSKKWGCKSELLN